METALAEAAGPDGPFAPAVLAELDQLEAFPAEACRALDALGLADHYVPARLGGKLVDHLGSSLMVRAVARRDLTVAIAHAKTFLGRSRCGWREPRASASGSPARSGPGAWWRGASQSAITAATCSRASSRPRPTTRRGGLTARNG